MAIFSITASIFWKDSHVFDCYNWLRNSCLTQHESYSPSGIIPLFSNFIFGSSLQSISVVHLLDGSFRICPTNTISNLHLVFQRHMVSASSFDLVTI
mmetsp:Transcript_17290/g.39026  ORF Transcript_17290/g.39026 Transcript_17290/m.39026 type:complete len:97 (-) Transcript_17290:1439-1729(-)